MTEELHPGMSMCDINYYFPLFSDDVSVINTHIKLHKYDNDIDDLVTIESYTSYGEDDSSMMTPLMYACMKDRHDVFDFLLQSGADINIKNDINLTVFHYAAIYGRTRMIEKIITNKKYDGSNINHLDVYLKNGNKDINIVYLLLPLSDVNAIDKYGTNCLMQAAFRVNSPEIIEFLINWTHNINQQDMEGTTALHWACRGKNTFNTVKLLLNAGADPNLLDKNGYTPMKLHSRMVYCDPQIISLLEAVTNKVAV